MAKVTPLALSVLELLLERPMHPYEMHRTMRHRHTDRVVKLKAGSLYHAVERLERLGLVEVAETGRSGRRPERTQYRITDAGRQTYEEHVPELIGVVAEEYPAFPLGLALADDLGRESMLEALRQRRVELQRLAAEYAAGMAHVVEIGLPKRFTLDIRYKVVMCRAELTFVTELIADMESGELDWEEKKPDIVHDLDQTVLESTWDSDPAETTEQAT